MLLGDIDLDTRTQEILLAASSHDLETLKPFLRIPGAASVQDSETGFTPLHAAIAACGLAKPSKLDPNSQKVDVSISNATSDSVEESKENACRGEEEVDVDKAKAVVKELFLSGAIWNDLDVNNETPGCLAWRLGQKELYELVVEAGVRAELLMNLMGGYEQLDSSSEDENEIEADAELNQESQHSPPVHSEPTTEGSDLHKDINSADYLKSSLTFSADKLLDSDNNGVMMSWETPIMKLTGSLLAPAPNLRILNIGFGLGIIDSIFANASPSAHHIIEAHPAVLSVLQNPPPSSLNFKKFGSEWIEQGNGNNVIHAGRWQDVVPSLASDGLVFDIIYFDTFGEDYSELKLFFSEYVITLLSPEGRFGFFNGLGADRRVCYDVYCKVVECDLLDAGLDVQWVDMEIDLDGETREKNIDGPQDEEEGTGAKVERKGLRKKGEGEWKGVRRRYWTLDTYRLPVCRFLG